MTKILTMLALLWIAPMQCGKEHDPNLRREDTAGDALWGLAEKFRAEKNEEGRKATLRYLAERYPSNRYAGAAREELGVDSGAP